MEEAQWQRDKWESWLPIVNDHLGATLYSNHFQLFMLIQYKMYCVFSFFLEWAGILFKGGSALFCIQTALIVLPVAAAAATAT